MRYLITCLALCWTMTAQAATSTPGATEYAYGTDPLQTMDVTPLAGATHAPILVMVHGGAWMLGDKTDVTVTEPKRSYFNQHGGFMFVSVNYRLTPKADAMAQAWDVAEALKFIEAHAKEWGGDPSRIIMMGHSAGGHLVTLLGADPAQFGLKPWAGTVALDGAAYDVRAIMNRPHHFTYYEPAFGTDPDHWDDASPLAQLKKGATPFFLVCSYQGPFLCSDAQQFADAAKKLGTPAIVNAEDLEHVEVNDTVGENGAYSTAIERFMRHYTK